MWEDACGRVLPHCPKEIIGVLKITTCDVVVIICYRWTWNISSVVVQMSSSTHPNVSNNSSSYTSREGKKHQSEPDDSLWFVPLPPPGSCTTVQFVRACASSVCFCEHGRTAAAQPHGDWQVMRDSCVFITLYQTTASLGGLLAATEAAGMQSNQIKELRYMVPQVSSCADWTNKPLLRGATHANIRTPAPQIAARTET